MRTGDLTTEQRWPAFSARAAAETGLRSMLSLRLFVKEDTLGALNLYSRDSHAFNGEGTAAAAGAIFATYAALALASAREQERVEQLQQALASSRTIGVAIGVLMARHRLGEDEAFDLLRGASQRANRKLRQIATDLVASEEAHHRSESLRG